MTDDLLRMSAEDSTALGELKQLWRDRYFVSYTGGRWSAWRLGNALHRLEAGSAMELRNMLILDHQQWVRDARKHNI